MGMGGYPLMSQIDIHEWKQLLQGMGYPYWHKLIFMMETMVTRDLGYPWGWEGTPYRHKLIFMNGTNGCKGWGYPPLAQINIHEWNQWLQGMGVSLLAQINIHEWNQWLQRMGVPPTGTN